MEFGKNPTQYYYVIMSLSLQTGICFGEKWHKNFEGLKTGYVDEIIAPSQTRENLIKVLSNFWDHMDFSEKQSHGNMPL